MLKYGTNKGLNWYFWARTLKKYYDILNEYTQICLVAKLHEKGKMLKYWIKNALFWRFWARILKHYCDISILETEIC